MKLQNQLRKRSPPKREIEHRESNQSAQQMEYEEVQMPSSIEAKENSSKAMSSAVNFAAGNQNGQQANVARTTMGGMASSNMDGSPMTSNFSDRASPSQPGQAARSLAPSSNQQFSRQQPPNQINHSDFDQVVMFGSDGFQNSKQYRPLPAYNGPVTYPEGTRNQEQNNTSRFSGPDMASATAGDVDRTNVTNPFTKGDETNANYM